MIVEFLSVFFSVILLIHLFLDNNIKEPLIDSQERIKLNKELTANEFLLDKVEEELDSQFDSHEKNEESIKEVEKLYKEVQKNQELSQ
tara:strand:+ start:2080 stop:2343 length:264 start_codon:yes stop_codon:yes gene_type:complete